MLRGGRIQSKLKTGSEKHRHTPGKGKNKEKRGAYKSGSLFQWNASPNPRRAKEMEKKLCQWEKHPGQLQKYGRIRGERNRKGRERITGNELKKGTKGRFFLNREGEEEISETADILREPGKEDIWPDQWRQRMPKFGKWKRQKKYCRRSRENLTIPKRGRKEESRQGGVCE